MNPQELIMKATRQSSVALMFAVSLAFAAQAHTVNGESGDPPIDALKRVYLVCERASTNGTLNADGVAYCSVVFEKLARRKCETGLANAIVARREYSSKDCGRLEVLLPRTIAP